jgi:hypothetical protein
MMQTIEELTKDYNEKMAKLTKELELAKVLPIAPHHVHAFKPVPWVTYKVDTATEAFVILDSFDEIVTVHTIKDGCTYEVPAEVHTEKHKEQLPATEQWDVALRTHGGVHLGLRFYSADIWAYARIKGVLFKVKIAIEKDARLYYPLGRWVTDAFHHVTRSEHRHRQLGESFRRKWSSGGDAFDFQYCYDTIEDAKHHLIDPTPAA